ncbi:hypothetical protein ASPTUDRAFT_57901 [Aspergillus tubingensis CBS 134.48]|uniref:Uncharacterized protein n=1 Tax=Aspergillus tubingensis (strain CBS 134.48) TaxID=767770 RepID=A0A1L9MZD8_ASPTC|nr:hypothetical protein ASPTUDRAFT_57901 [Aspergillus tubingensis CBS 134.48]
MVLDGPRVDRAPLINPETRSGNVGCRPLYDNAVNARDCEAEDATTRADVAVMSGLIVMDLHWPRQPRREATKLSLHGNAYQMSRVNPATSITESPVSNNWQRTSHYRPLPNVYSGVNGLDRPLRQPSHTRTDTDE